MGTTCIKCGVGEISGRKFANIKGWSFLCETCIIELLSSITPIDRKILVEIGTESLTIIRKSTEHMRITGSHDVRISMSERINNQLDILLETLTKLQGS